MSRMMARSRWTQRPWAYCCPGHDPDLYSKGSQRAKERRSWQADWTDDVDRSWWERHDLDWLLTE
jgi:hypothetical protein